MSADPGGIYRNILTLSPNLLITKDEIDQATDLLGQFFKRLQSSGL